MKQNNRRQLLALPMGLWAYLFVGISLLYVVGLSFLSTGEGFSVSGPIGVHNYARLKETQYISSLLLSLRLAALTTLICAVVGYPFAYFISKTSPKTRTWLLILLIAPFWTNALIRIYGWKILFYANGPINTALKSLGIIQRPLKLLYTELSVLIGMVYGMLPFFVLPVYSSVERIDWSMVEASRDLGANPFKAFLTVTVPMTASGLMAGVVLTFIPSVGLFFISDLLGGSNTMLWGNLIQNELLKSHDMPFAATLSVILLVMTAIVLIIYRKKGGEAENMAF
ncbi:MAG: ABC transporter permease [Eubacteriales bacterium]|nr:ABC transporter permease [Eubacteriales bacterium]